MTDNISSIASRSDRDFGGKNVDFLEIYLTNGSDICNVI